MSEAELRKEFDDKLSDLRRYGCGKAGEHSEAVNTLKETVKQHDKRIGETEKDVREINTKLDMLPEQVAEKVNGNNKSQRTMVPLKIGPLRTEVPASWIGWAIMLILMAIGVWFHRPGKSERDQFIETLKPVIQRLQVSTNGISISGDPR